MSEPTSGLRRASKAHPCPVCGGANSASRAASAAGLLHEAILALLKEAGEAGLTRKQLWDKLPEAVKKNEPRFKVEVESGVGQSWRKEERAARQGGAVYRVLF